MRIFLSKKRSGYIFSAILIFGIILYAFATSGIFGFKNAKAETIIDGLGTVSFKTSRAIGDVNISEIESRNDLGIQHSFLAEYQPKGSQTKAFMSFGSAVNEGLTMSEAVSLAEINEKQVVFGINADAYEDNVPYGLMIQDGRLVSTPLTSNGLGSDALGFKADGSIISGAPDLEISTVIDKKNTTIRHINKFMTDASVLYLFTDDYSKIEGTVSSGIQVVIKLDAMSRSTGMTIGGSATGKVESVSLFSNAGEKKTMEKGTVVLACSSTSGFYSRLNSLTTGDSLTISVTDKANKWQDVVNGVGVFQVLVKNGQILDGVASNKEKHPRTGLGIKADGSIVVLVTDGRQEEWSIGLTWMQMCEFMIEKGCTEVFNFDGGGSSVFSAYIKEDKATEMLNRPSDGKERANSNYLLFLAELGIETDYNIDLGTFTGGSITGDTMAKAGEDKTFFVIENTGFELAWVKVNGASVIVTDNKFIVKGIEGDIVITAEFQKINTKKSGCNSAVFDLGNAAELYTFFLILFVGSLLFLEKFLSTKICD